MKIGPFDLTKKVLLVAEIGNNHEGNFPLAQKMIRQAARAGAGAVKFQTIVPERLVSSAEKERLRQLERFRFSYDQFKQLSETAKKENVLFLSTPFDLESVRRLNPLVPAFKIASGDNNFFPLLEAVARTGKPVILSTGLTDLKQIEATKRYLENIWRQEKLRPALALLHCVSSYPTAPEEANLLAIRQLAALGATVGYSDHTIGIEAAVLAVALGARIIEKHFTLDKNHSDFHDHKLSADPKEFAELSKRIEGAIKLMGSGVKRLQESEKRIEKNVRRSIAAGKNLHKGSILNLEDLTWVRPAVGLPPGEEDKIIGRTLKRAVLSGEAIRLADLE